ncbi:hypothetical protein Tco_1023085 [Tanacetum coccineum]
MDDPNLTMEEYIRLEEEKAHKRRKVFNWQTATYGKIRVDDDLYNLSSVEAEFPDIVINDAVVPQDELLRKSQVSTPVNDEIDFRISFDESDDEDYTIFFDKNLFSYKMISVNDLKTDLENDYEKVMPSIPSPEPAISCFDDLDFFTNLENEFPAIVYNDAQTKVGLQGWIRRIRIKPIRHMALPPSRIHRREVHRVPVFDFGGLPDLMAEGLSGRMLMEHRDEAGASVFTNGISSAGDFLGTAPSYTLIRDPILRLCHRLIACSIAGRSQAPKKVIVTDLFYLRGMDVGSVNVPYLLARYLRLFTVGRKSGAHISDGQFVARLAEHFGLLTAEILGGLTICVHFDDTWALLAIGPERQPIAAAGAPAVVEDAPIIDEGGQADPAPEQAPQQPPPPSSAAARTIPQRLGRLEEDVQGLRRDVGSLRGLVEISMTDQGRFSTWMMTPREGNIDEYWWRIYESGNLEVLES